MGQTDFSDLFCSKLFLWEEGVDVLGRREISMQSPSAYKWGPVVSQNRKGVQPLQYGTGGAASKIILF